MAEQIDRLREGLAGQYEVERAVGQGGMATVYLARDVRHERRVAIKVLKPELAASLGHERFLREIKLAAQLQHPNILGFYESGEVDGLVYYVMPFIEGESLRDRIDKEKQLPIEDAVRIVREAGEALGYAHSHGVIHRDIKPENILLLNGHALVADFGIAKAVEAAGAQKLTETGMAVGTPHYMSPEQALGGTVDGRSDQYSLACVLYECLIGQGPFDGPTPMAILARHAMEQVPSMQVVRSAIPDAVEDVVFRAMEKTPADRFPSMKEFCEALEDAEAEVMMQRTMSRRAVGASGPRTAQHRAATGAVSARRATTPIQVDTLEPKKKWPMMVAAGLAVAALAGGGFWMTRAKAAAKPATAEAGADARRIAVLYFEDQSDNHALGYLTDGLTEDLIGQLARVQSLDVISRNGVAQFRGREVPRDSIARALNVGTLVVGSVEPAGPDKVRVTTRLIDASGTEINRSSFEQAAGDAAAMRDVLSGRVAEFLRERLGQEVRLREQRQRTASTEAWVLLQRAEAQFKQVDSLAKLSPAAAAKALSTADSILGLAAAADPQWPDPLVLRGTVASRQIRLSGTDPLAAGPLVERGLAHVEQALSIDPQNAAALFQRGDLRYWRWLTRQEVNPVEADKLLASAQADFEAATKLDPSEARAWASLSHLYYQTAGATEAKLAARRAYEEDAYLGNIDVVMARLFLASYDLGQFAEAKQWCEEGARRFPTNYRFAMCRLRLLGTRAAEPDVPRAWRLRDSVATLAPEGEREFRTLSAQLAVAAVLARASLSDSARRVIERSRAGGEVDPSRDLMEEEAFVYTLLGDNAAAFKALKAYWTANPSHQKDLAQDAGWKFEALRSDPAWQKLVGSP